MLLFVASLTASSTQMFDPIPASGSTWKMTNLEVVNLPINGQFHTLAMGARTVAGDKVEAPVGLSFACAEDGHFRSNRSMPVSGSLRFPGWRMQVFEVRRGQFGPMWECGELMSIGLWVGLLVTLGFTLICAWGFSMLASINVSHTVVGSLNNATLCCRLWTDLMIPRGKIFTFHRQQIRTILICYRSDCCSYILNLHLSTRIIVHLFICSRYLYHHRTT